MPRTKYKAAGYQKPTSRSTREEKENKTEWSQPSNTPNIEECYV
jgi:hypothetical protein